MTIGIIGYGELGKQFENLIKLEFPNYNFIYFDDCAFNNNLKNSYKFSDYLNVKFVKVIFLVALGYRHLDLKYKIINELACNKKKLLSFIHKTAIIDPSVIIEEGTVIYPNVVLDKNVYINKGCVLNLSVTVAHDTTIGQACFLAPSVTVSGFSKIGNKCFIGTNATIIDNISIVDDVFLGAASLVIKNITENGKYYGAPIKKQ